MIPVRFSLRSFFVFATLVAVICAWCALPSIAARRFVRALADRDYRAADEMFLWAGDRCLAEWDDKLWSFRATGHYLAPVTIGQLVRGHRLVRFNINYFALDQSVNRDVEFAVTTFGVRAPAVGKEQYGGRIIDSISSPIIERIPKPIR